MMLEIDMAPGPGVLRGAITPLNQRRQETFVTKVFVAAADDGKEQSGKSRKVHCVTLAIQYTEYSRIIRKLGYKSI